MTITFLVIKLVQGFYFTKSMQGMATNYPYYHSQTNQAKDSLSNVFGSIEQYLFLIAKQTLSKAHEICAKRDYDPEELFAHSNHATYSGKESERSYVNF